MRGEVRDTAMLRALEIEEAIRGLPEVHDAFVAARECVPGGPQVVAYVVPDGPFDPPRLRGNLGSRLPEGVPSIAFVPVSSLPLTVSGEVDEEALSRLAVIDSSVVKEWEERVRSVPGVDQAAVVVEEDFEPIPALHLSELLPGWKSATARDIDHSHTAPVQEQAVRDEAGVPAISHGEPLGTDSDAAATLPHALERAARVSPARGVVYIQHDGSETFQSYPALLEEAQRILAGLRDLGLKPRDKVLFQLERIQDFIPAFWGCQLGGFVPVPISIAPTYSGANSAVGKLQNAWQMLDRPVILTGKALAKAIRSLPDMADSADLRVATIDELRRCAADRAWHESRPDDLAILLLTSGSTGLPKAVMQSHGGLLSESAGTSRMNRFSAAEVSLNWMPLDHVGGIVMFHVRDVFLGCQQIHAVTELILQEPLRWLDLIARFRATLTWAPNFAFALVNAREEAIRERHWDLSSMRFILNGGEAIVARTARRFLQMLRPHGLPGTCMHPAWGMSETSSGVTYSDCFSVETTSDDDSFVEVGAPIPGFSMRIVDARDRLAREEEIGRLQVRGPSVTSGYYRNPGLTRNAFSADGWFETGDLGFLRRGRLTITGREKDVIIVNGINYHSHEIEAVVEEIPGVVVSYTAACPVRDRATDTDQLAVFFHPASNEDIALAGLLKTIRESVVKRIGITPEYLIPVEESDVPKTAIGKIQRTQLSQRFNAGEFGPVLKRVDILSGNANTVPAWFYRKVWRRKRTVGLRDGREIRPALVFLDQSGLGKSLCAELSNFKTPHVGVEAGPDFDKLATNRYRVNPRDPDHYRRLLVSIAADGVRIEQILHLWAFDLPVAEIATAEQLERSQDQGVYSLLFLVQALARRQEGATAVNLRVVARNSQCVLGDDESDFAKGPILGFIRSVTQEMPWLQCQHLDLPSDDPRANAARILGEIRSAARDTEVAYRQGERWIPRLRQVDFLHQQKHELPFRRGGMYLLGGGLGGIGVEVARYLLQQFEAKLLVVGRTPLAQAGSPNVDDGRAGASERIKAYRELEQLPGEIQYEAADIADLTALRQAVERARGRWACDLDGVIQLAGIYRRTPLTDETREDFADVLRPKVLGTWALSQVLEDRPDKVFISFSSLSSFFGGALVGAYSAANSFLDAFAQHQLRRRSTRNYCLEWSLWDELGMSRGLSMRELLRSRGFCAISGSQGLHSFLAALHLGEGHILVGLDGSSEHVRRHADSDPVRMRRLCAYFATGAGGAADDRLRGLSVRDRFGTRVGCEFQRMQQLPRTDLGEIDRDKLARLRRRGDRRAVEAIAPRTELERRIAGFWREVLSIPEIGIHDDVFELGANSLLVTQVASRIQEAYRVQLSIRTMLEEATVAKLAQVVQRRLEDGNGGRPDVIERIEASSAGSILAKLDQLSDEDVSSMLKEALARDAER